MNSTTPFPSEMRPARSREDAQQPKSPFETLEMCDTINHIITDLTDRLDPVLGTEPVIVKAEQDPGQLKPQLLARLEQIVLRLSTLNQRVTL